MSNKLKKRSILRKNKQFQAVYRIGKSYSNRMVVLYVSASTVDKRRIGFAAGKRLGCAVVRNRIKRLLREVYRLEQQELVVGVDLILVGRQGMIGANLAQAQTAVRELFRRSRLLRKTGGMK